MWPLISMFLFHKYLLSTCYELGTGPENGDMAVDKFNVIAGLIVWGLMQPLKSCPNGRFWRRKTNISNFAILFSLVWALLKLIDFSYESCWRKSAILRGIDCDISTSLVRELERSSNLLHRGSQSASWNPTFWLITVFTWSWKHSWCHMARKQISHLNKMFASVIPDWHKLGRLCWETSQRLILFSACRFLLFSTLKTK